MLYRALKLLRTYHQISQKDLARKFEISNSYLCEIEKGTKMPAIDLLGKYSDLFQMPVSTILLFSEKMENPERSREKIRVAAANKILRILEWIDEREQFENHAETISD